VKLDKTRKTKEKKKEEQEKKRRHDVSVMHLRAIVLHKETGKQKK